MPINGLVVMTPTSIASTGTGNSSSIGANGEVTFSSCATLSLNGAFTSSYDNYFMSVRLQSNGNARIAARLRLSGSDNSTANSYTYQYLSADGTSVTGERTTTTEFSIGGVYNTQRAGTSVFLFGPALAQPTAMRNVSASDYLSAYLFDFSSTHNQSTAYDGITIYPVGGGLTISGAITVYGFNQ